MEGDENEKGRACAARISSVLNMRKGPGSKGFFLGKKDQTCNKSKRGRLGQKEKYDSV